MDGGREGERDSLPEWPGGKRLEGEEEPLSLYLLGTQGKRGEYISFYSQTGLPCLRIGQ